jgi:uncharacterized protein YjiK
MKKSLFFALILMGVLFYPAAIADATCMPYRSIVVVNRIGSAEKLFLAQLHKFGIPPANYSGIAKVSENRFAVVSDKEDGFYLFEIKTNKEKNQIISCTRGELRNNPFPGDVTQNEQVEVPPIDSLSADSSSLNKLSVSNIPTTVKKMNIIRGRDCEGIVYVPNRGTVFISGEEDQRIIEYDTLGTPTGRELAVPDLFSRQNISPNYGFEALAFDNLSGRFYTTTENTLPADGPVASPDNHSPARLRIQSFGSDMQPAESYAYMTDAPVANNLYSHYAFGVPAMYALSADTLLLLEREFFVGKSLEVIKSYVVNRLFKVVLSPKYEIAQGELLHERSNELFLKKTLVYEWDTTFGAGIANYEGMCVAGVTPGGRPILYLINDSQAGYKGVLKEFILMLAL